jgi:hypothetical protein
MCEKGWSDCGKAAGGHRLMRGFLLAVSTREAVIITDYDFDVGVIGGATAGLTVTSGAAQLGAKLHHHDDKRRIFRCRNGALLEEQQHTRG